LGIGIPKAVYSYYGQSLISPSLDWVGGVVFGLLLFWLGVIEATRPELCPSFFEVDLAPAILVFLGRDDTPSPLDPENHPPSFSNSRGLGGPMSPTVQLAGTTPNHETIDPAIPGFKPLPSKFADQSWSYLDVHEKGYSSDDEALGLIPEGTSRTSGHSHDPITAARMRSASFQESWNHLNVYEKRYLSGEELKSRPEGTTRTSGHSYGPITAARIRRPLPQESRSYRYLSDDEELESRPEGTSRTRRHSHGPITAARIRRAPPQESRSYVDVHTSEKGYYSSGEDSESRSEETTGTSGQ